MLIDLALLPPNIAQQIKQIPQDGILQFAEDGKIIVNLKQSVEKTDNNISSYDMLMGLDFPQGIENITEEPFVRLSSQRMDSTE